jgi:glycosyltransferase involved in cell wall biosynthesis
MRIAVIGTRGFPNVQGGIEKHCENLYPRLVKRGCQVYVFTRTPYVEKGIRSHGGVQLIPLSCPKNKYTETMIHTFKAIIAAKKLHPDLVHIHGIGPAILLPFARLMGMRTVMTHHGPDYKRRKWGLLPQLVLRLGEAVGTRLADEVICVSSEISATVARKRSSRPHTIPNGIGIPGRVESEEALKRFRLEKRRYILTVGRFVPEKGFDDLIRAFGKVMGSADSWTENRVREEGWKLVIVGGADHESGYSVGLRRRAGADPMIVLTGFISGKPLQELYSHAGLFVLASYYEGLPIVLLEAMGYGASCLASDIAANKEIDLGPGRYFKTGDVNDLADRIVALASTPLSGDERENQQLIVRQRYSWDDIARRTLEVYKRIRSESAGSIQTESPAG